MHQSRENGDENIYIYCVEGRQQISLILSFNFRTLEVSKKCISIEVFVLQQSHLSSTQEMYFPHQFHILMHFVSRLLVSETLKHPVLEVSLENLDLDKM